MDINLKKFGTTLVSRQSGREAYLAIKSSLENILSDEGVIVDFDGVNTFTPSWGDEFLSPLLDLFQKRLVLKNTANVSVAATLSLLQQTNNIKFNIEQ